MADEQKKPQSEESTTAADDLAVEKESPAADAATAKEPAAGEAKAAASEEAKASKKKPSKKDAKAKDDDKAAGKAEGGDAAMTAAASAPTAAELLADDFADKKIVKAKKSKHVTNGIAMISATFNNTLVSITDMQGNVISWSSSGKVGFKGSRKSTSFAAQQVAQDAARQAMAHGLREVEVRVKGPGSGRESAIRALQSIGLEITSIMDVTPVPHNGCRPKKKRRV